MNSEYQWIVDQLPYTEPFLFVDEITSIDESGVKGYYNFHKDLSFYRGHFKDNPITPGVILTECAAQIGLVSFAIFLHGDQDISELQIGMSSSEMEFYKPVYPQTKIFVESEKKYFRFGKLKCSVKLFNEENELVAKGEIAGMIAK